MSNFNTRKDRDRHGKANPHFRIKYPSRWGVMYVHHYDQYGANTPACNYDKNPGWWNRINTTRRRRAADRLMLTSILRGVDPDGVTWLADKRPSIYYW